MLDHHLQRSIVYRLAFSSGLRFSELKPDTVENKLFDYHLKKVLAAGYVMKDGAGLYILTPEGRRLGTRILDGQQTLADQPESVLFLIIRRVLDGAWLMYTRSTHPMLGYSGFMHCTPNAYEHCEVTAARECQERTGLQATFRALGGGYSRIKAADGTLESFTNFTLLVSDDAEGELVQHDEFAEYYWEAAPHAERVYFPTTTALVEAYERNKPFFIELSLTAN